MATDSTKCQLGQVKVTHKQKHDHKWTRHLLIRKYIIVSYRMKCTVGDATSRVECRVNHTGYKVLHADYITSHTAASNGYTTYSKYHTTVVHHSLIHYHTQKELYIGTMMPVSCPVIS